MRRIFIAVKVHPGDNLKNMLSSVRNDLAGENIKWIDPDNIHVTLAFLGETEESRIQAVIKVLRGTCSGFGKFEFILKNAGVFKSLTNPRVIWVGVDAPVELVMLNDIINKRLKDLEFQIEDRIFRPHVTIGRVKLLQAQDSLKSLIEKYRDVEFQKVPVEEVILYESILGGPAPVYKPVFTALL